ncbi:MAG: ABC transporter ATP-binding protein/permease [Clostridiaceae bacterium]|jgi:putative ABC transport system permease protein|nr:ABC transporter ATP-binding protein/permease [Clostridiaceae bacterium]
MLKLKDIKKDYIIGNMNTARGRSKATVTRAVNGINVEFRDSEFVAILGPSGCGKTTLLNIIGGLDQYTSGDLIISGKSTKNFKDSDWDAYRNKSVGFVFQNYNLIMHQSVASNVELALEMSGLPRSETKKRAADMLAEVGLSDHSSKKPNQLSGGQMQRVAIARAIVNDPDIILADEPTGALDSDTSLQVMDILKKLSEKKLVIMVTHNPEIAATYATRIITLVDGQVTSDSAPYKTDKDGITEHKDKDLFAWYAHTEEEAVLPDDKENQSVVADESPSEAQANADVISLDAQADTEVSAATDAGAEGAVAGHSLFKKRPPLCERLKRDREKRVKIEKSSLSYNNALKLSWNNLFTKRGRTVLTSIAGSIGIIGIALVLALSSGFSNYINQVEEDSLSKYPLEISRNSVDVSEALKMLSQNNDSGRVKYPDTNNIFVGKSLGNLIGSINTIISDNDLKSFKIYLDNNFKDSSDGYVKYDYGSEKFIYSNYSSTTGSYNLVEPFTDAMQEVVKKLDIPGIDINSLMGSGTVFGDMLPGFTMNMNAWDELIDNQKLLEQQYKILGGRWPDQDAKDELVLVVDEYNQISDMTLFMLGLKSPDDIADALLGKSEFLSAGYTVEQLIGIEYKLLRRCDLFAPDPDNAGKWLDLVGDAAHTDGLADKLDAGLTLKITGVVRLREGATSGAINGSAAYTKALAEWLVTSPEESDVIKAQRDAYASSKEAIIGTREAADKPLIYRPIYTTIELNAELKQLGFNVEGLESPEKISLYANSLESKQNIISMIEHYNEIVGSKSSKYIRYTDTLGLLMGAIELILTSITYILIGFSAISLIVSSIMIAIITYTSVLERTKEIGILRSLGARKKDIARVFNSETSLIGVFSGIIGIVFVGILQVPISILLEKMLGIPDLMTVLWWHGILMVALSVVLSLIAGVIPSQVAANKNPVSALKAE